VGATGMAAGFMNVPQTRVSDPLPPVRSASAPVVKTPSRTPMLVGAAVGVLLLAGAGWMFFSGRGTNRDAGSATAAQQPAASGAQATGTTGGPQVSGNTAPQVAAGQSQGAAAVVPYSSPVNATSTQRPISQAGDAAPSNRGSNSVTGAAPGKSYDAELLALEKEIQDSSSAVAVGRKLPAWRNRVTLASDVAILRVVEAEVASLTLEAAQACKIWKSIKPEDLGGRLRNTYTAGMQSCEGT
jgi:hypothetical protein